MNPTSYEQLKDMASVLARSGCFGAKTMEGAFALMARGMSLGIAPVTALCEMHLIDGRAELSADLMAALVLRSGLCEEWTYVESSAERCELRTRRKGASQPTTVVWTTERAKRADLAKRTNFQRYPEAMLRARAISELVRMTYPDVASGVYVYGEIGAEKTEGAQFDRPERPESELLSGLPGQMPLALSAASVLASDAMPADAPQVQVVRVQTQAQTPIQIQAQAPIQASPLLARITPATTGRDLLALARDVSRDRSTWSAYAAEWARRAGTYDLTTLQQVQGLLRTHLAEEVRADEAFAGLEETIRERLAVLTETESETESDPETSDESSDAETQAA